MNNGGKQSTVLSWESIPTPFGNATSALRGELTQIGTKAGHPVVDLTFGPGETSELLPAGYVVYAAIPNVSSVVHGLPLSSVLTAGKRLYGYRYTSLNATIERQRREYADAHPEEPLQYRYLFPGQFFASDITDAFVSGFTAQHPDIQFLPLTGVTFERNARYIFLPQQGGTVLTGQSFAVCGDWSQDFPEECDDGNTQDGDGCSSICQTETGQTCPGLCCSSCQGSPISGTCGGNDVCCDLCATDPVCGNGQTESPEQCDDSNQDNTDSCTNLCEDARCGDTFIQQGVEQCDDGNTDDGDGCSANCQNEQQCQGQCCSTCQGSPISGTCGGTDVCCDVCETNPVCGDGTQEGAEQCDDGNQDNTDNCTNICEDARCGDTHIQPPEQCDDGNTEDGDGCSAQCADEVVDPPCTGQCCSSCEGSTMPGVCGESQVCCYVCHADPICGNSIREEGEQCDDANLIDGDGCSSICTFEPPQTCTGLCCASGCNGQVADGTCSNIFTSCCTQCATSCGDGVRQGSEQCDDGNTDGGDGCSGSCTYEQPPQCSATLELIYQTSPASPSPPVQVMSNYFWDDPELGGNQYNYAPSTDLLTVMHSNMSLATLSFAGVPEVQSRWQFICTNLDPQCSGLQAGLLGVNLADRIAYGIVRMTAWGHTWMWIVPVNYENLQVHPALEYSEPLPATGIMAGDLYLRQGTFDAQNRIFTTVMSIPTGDGQAPQRHDLLVFEIDAQNPYRISLRQQIPLSTLNWLDDLAFDESNSTVYMTGQDSLGTNTVRLQKIHYDIPGNYATLERELSISDFDPGVYLHGDHVYLWGGNNVHDIDIPSWEENRSVMVYQPWSPVYPGNWNHGPEIAGGGNLLSSIVQKGTLVIDAPSMTHLDPVRFADLLPNEFVTKVGRPVNDPDRTLLFTKENDPVTQEMRYRAYRMELICQ